MPEERRLLVAGDPRDRQRRAEQLGLADHLGRPDEAGQQRAVDAEQLEQLVVPVERVEVEQHRPRRVRQVGGVHAAAGELPDRATSRRCRTRARSAGRSLRASSHSSFVAEKYGSGTSPVRARIRSAGSSRHRSAVRRSCQTIARCDRPPGRALPEQRRLALVRDPDRAQVGRADACGAHAPHPQPRRRSPRSPPGRARPTRAAGSAAGARGSRARARAARRRRRGRSSPSSPGRSRGSRARASVLDPGADRVGVSSPLSASVVRRRRTSSTVSAHSRSRA